MPVMIARDRRVHSDRGPTQVRSAPWGDCKRSYWLRFFIVFVAFPEVWHSRGFLFFLQMQDHTNGTHDSLMSAHLHYYLGLVHTALSVKCNPNSRLGRVGEHLQPRAPTMIYASKSLGILGFLT